jgi:hypothetical protein
MNTLSHKTCMIIKLSYVALSVALLLSFVKEAYSFSFKFVISSIGIFTFFSIFLCSVLQKGFKVVYYAIFVFALLYILNLIFIISSVVNTDFLLLTLDQLTIISPVVALVVLTGLLYLTVQKCLCFTSPAEKRILKLFIAFLLALVVVEKVISISLPGVSNILLGVMFMFIISEYITIGINSYYAGDKEK